MAKLELTDAFIRTHPVPDKIIEIADKAPGLAIRITPKGHKVFVFRYKFAGTSKRFFIGTFGAVDLKKARKEAGGLHLDVKKGIDPQADKVARMNEPKSIRFKELADTFKAVQYPNYRESTKTFYGYIIDNKLVPVFGKREIDKITKPEVVRFLDNIAIINNGRTMANRTRERLHHLFEFAKSRGMTDNNPVTGIKPYDGGENESERYYEADEIKKLWESFETMREPMRSYLKIITLTGQRRTETQFMRWDNIQHVENKDFIGYIWTIPKSLAKSGRDHEVPLSPLAVDIIESLRGRAGENPFVFASGGSDEIPFGQKTIKRGVIDIQNTCISDFRLHDMRRTVATNLAELGTPAEVVSKVLNHKTGGGGSLVTRIYNRYEYRKERQLALNKWEQKIREILTGKNRKIIGRLGS